MPLEEPCSDLCAPLHMVGGGKGPQFQHGLVWKFHVQGTQRNLVLYYLIWYCLSTVHIPPPPSCLRWVTTIYTTNHTTKHYITTSLYNTINGVSKIVKQMSPKLIAKVWQSSWDSILAHFFCCWMWCQSVFPIYWSHQQARKIYMTTAIVEYNINSLNHTMLHEIYSSDNKYLCVCAT